LKKGDKIENNGNSSRDLKVLRCINIDCVFNSSNEFGGTRNTCSHPKVAVESRFADITIAICSEFRSKKDYTFEKPVTIIELKSGERTEIVSVPELGVTPVEKVTTEELEKSVSPSVKKPEQVIIPTVKPQIIEASPVPQEDISFSQKYNLTDNPRSDFLILRKFYQPYTKQGFIISVIFHIVVIIIMYQFIVPNEDDPNQNHQQRIVVVEDLDMPKFDPPDVDKMKEDEEKKTTNDDGSSDIRPKINTKKITPRINRPSTDDKDTNNTSLNDTNVAKNDSNLVNKNQDTSKYIIPDSLRTSFSENEVGLYMQYDKTQWNLIDSRSINSNKNFTGVILGIDSTKEDYKGVTVIINIDDPVNPKYNKITYKNLFAMDDTTVFAYATDPIKLSGKKSEYKYYLFTDNTNQKNIQINTEFINDAMVEKYKKVVDAIIRTIKIIPPQPKSDK